MSFITDTVPGMSNTTTPLMFDPREPRPDECELVRCDNPYIEGTGDFDEGHWVCDQKDCGTHLTYDQIRALSDEDMAEFLRKIDYRTGVGS